MSLDRLVRSLAIDGQTIEAIEDPASAIRAACLPGSKVIVAGSIFLVGPLRGILR
jgi:hypothetical protein